MVREDGQGSTVRRELRLFLVYVTEAAGSVHDYYFGQVLDDRDINPLGAPKERYKISEEIG